ncbi:beta-propeller fold lactonase family protein [Ralstonia sp. SET104]|uniref:lactonase family protein n=1 Tax=Ralstonia sp. SET104 TaxID=2448774 RepID=UPI000FFA93F0|nr:beta-propeller fold lactonase family protein [Ralstonia sp. SET104]GCB05129.1 6-phosphogluconolactonase [Ralstonia sp. SET104]
MQQLRRMIFPAAPVMPLTSAGVAGARGKTYVYVSNAEDGNIDGYEMDVSTGSLTSIGKTQAGKLVMPMALSVDKRHLYAVIRSQPFVVLTYAIDALTGHLSQQASAPLPDSMAYVSTDLTGRFLFTASYGGNKIAVNPIEASGLVESGATQVIPSGENAHCIRVDRSNRYGYAANLGSNQIQQFRFDANSGRLTENPTPRVKARPGEGPRHLVFSPDNTSLYVLNELSGNVAQFSIDDASGVLTEVAYTGTVPPDSPLEPGFARTTIAAAVSPAKNAQTAGDEKARIWAADLQITPDGKFLYASERTDSKIALLAVEAGTGKLKYVKNYPTETQPRGMRIDPSGTYLIVAGEKSDRLAVYRIDRDNGELECVGRIPVGRGANWVEIVTLP